MSCLIQQNLSELANRLLAALTKKQERRLKRQQASNPEVSTPKVPLHEQTIDLPAGHETLDAALDAYQARGKLTKAMRENRRAKIKESNFLKSMS